MSTQSILLKRYKTPLKRTAKVK